ncbi:hypothetical protein HK097_009887 [Rhizophlyctis rosea]|uniref:WD repeat-containing protein 55 homolog n=1 Tax=Rhizophlyctis rosea TaxID=64517 RepID=A0AAD5S9X2_9FUNG|nr:hypothetical protein HK097_009887 [Rhizophlyctis rosea]
MTYRPSANIRAPTGIFAPFRALGYVTSDLPIVIQARGAVHSLTTSIGNSFQIYDGEKLALQFVGSRVESLITALAVHKDFTYAAVGNQIIVHERAKEISRITIEDEENVTITSLHIYGELILVVCDDNVIRMYNLSDGELHNELELAHDFRITCLLHPSTYLNKVLLGSQDGRMQLWNIRTMRLLYEFKRFESPITFLAQAPSVDVVAIGLLDGSIILQNIKVDEKIMRLKQEGKITAISFRTDDKHIMATASMHGDIALWDLDTRKLFHIMKEAHDGAVHTMQFYNGQPILMTAGSDNSIKQWIFDNLDGHERLLRSRSGHYQPPTHIRHYGGEGQLVLSAGRDRTLRTFSTFRDVQNVELSQGSLERNAKNLGLKVEELKASQILGFDACDAKQRDWDNIVTCHANDGQGRTWSFHRKAIGTHLLPTTDSLPATAVAISACGNFGFMGSSGGIVDRYNLQSGLHRKTYGGKAAHKKAIVGIVSDNINRVVMTASLDATVKFWDFNNAKLLHSITLPAAASHLILHRESGLLAIAADDLCIRVVDVDTKRIVREFWGHRNRLTDLAFSPDGRWLITSSMDATIRTWDLPTGHMVDVFKVDSVATSISMSPTGDFLATAHADHVGIFTWTNRAQFANLSLRNLGEEDVEERGLPGVAGGEEADEEDAAVEDGVEAPKEDGFLRTPQDLTDQMITLSSLPKSRWQNLLSLDAIRKRNKPVEPPKAPEKAPFFLATLPGVDPKFVANKDAMDIDDGNDSRVLRMGEMNPETEFVRRLRSGNESGDYSQFFEYAQTLGPAAMDFEIRSMSLENEMSDFRSFVKALQQRLEERVDFEVVEAYLNAFLKIHGDVLVNASVESGIKELFEEFLKEHKKTWSRLEELFQYGLCLIDFVKTRR